MKTDANGRNNLMNELRSYVIKNKVIWNRLDPPGISLVGSA